VLSGGTGTPKLLAGLARNDSDFTVAVNTAEDLWLSGNLVCPDIDSVLYTLSGRIDTEKWWGVAGDTFRTHERLKELGHPEMLALGDMDRATHVVRSDLIRGGATLTEATAELCGMFGVSQRVLPMSNEPIATMIELTDGEVHFQEFWVARGGKPEVLGVRLDGKLEPSPDFIEALDGADGVLIGPSNPVTSIGPITALDGVVDALKKKRVVAVSPFVGEAPLSGPAAKLMRTVGREPSARGMAELYREFLDVAVVHEGDGGRLDGVGVEVVETDIRMPDVEAAERLAMKVVGLF